MVSKDVARWVEMQTHKDARGDLSIGECGKQIPFDIKRVYYSYNVPAGSNRAGVGHRTLEQVIVAVSGGLVIEVEDGVRKEEFLLNDPARAVYIPAMRWRVLRDFTPGAVALVLASETYNPAEPIKDYGAFLAEAQG